LVAEALGVWDEVDRFLLHRSAPTTMPNLQRRLVECYVFVDDYL
jgi:hypothetical protein